MEFTPEEQALIDRIKNALPWRMDMSCGPRDFVTNIAEHIIAEIRIANYPLRKHIEDVVGLEPTFSSLVDCIPEKFETTDPEKRYAVYDAEMTCVCRCEDPEYADLVRDLLNRATEGNGLGGTETCNPTITQARGKILELRRLYESSDSDYSAGVQEACDAIGDVLDGTETQEPCEALLALADLEGTEGVEATALKALNTILGEFGRFPNWEKKWPNVVAKLNL